MGKVHKTTQNKINREYLYLLRGDLKKVATELNCSYQKVRDYVRGKVHDQRVGATLAKLNEARKKEANVQSDKAVKEIINQNNC